MEKTNKKGIIKRLFSAVLALALILTLLPGSTTVKAAAANVSWDRYSDACFQKEQTVSSHETKTSFSYGGVTMTPESDAVFKTLRSPAGGWCMQIELPYAGNDRVKFQAPEGKNFSKVVVDFTTISNDNGAELGSEWKFNDDNQMIWTGSDSEVELYYEPNVATGSVTIQYITSIAFYYDTRVKATTDQITYNKRTQSLSSPADVTIGDFDTVYLVDGEWEYDKPTQVGTYQVGAYLYGNDTYLSGYVTDESWTYEVTYKDYKENRKSDSNALTTTIKNSADATNKAVLSAEELEKVKAGQKAIIEADTTLVSDDYMTTVDWSDYCSAMNKVMENELAGQYKYNNKSLKVNLWKMFDEDGEDATQVTDTDGKLKIAVTVPWSLDSIEYKLIYIDGENGTLINPEVGGEKNNELIFETDKFSGYYAIVYKDAASTDPTTDKKTDKTTNKTTDTTPVADRKADVSLSTDAKFSTSDYVGKSMKVTTKNGGWYFSNVASAVEFDPSFETGKELADISQKLSTVTLPSTLKYITLDFAYSGDLPGTASVTVDLASAGFTEGSTVYLYYYNPNINSFELVCDSTYLNGSATFTMAHCSEYIVTNEKLPDTLTSTEATATSPKTGDTTSAIPFVLVLICGLGAIGAVIVRRKVVR